MNKTIIAYTLLTIAFITSPAHAVDIVLGKKVANKCTMCHTFGQNERNKVGPNLFGIMGSNIASVEKYRYSKAFLAKKEEGFIWNKETLNDFLTKPKAYIKKTKMAFAGIKNKENRSNLITYLDSLK